MKNYKLIMTISLGILILSVTVTAVCAIAGIAIPDTAVRIMGICDLITLPTAAFTCTKIILSERNTDKKRP
ncbi:MAG: hypothetical protein J6X85_06985 [Ruminococcus sp.]|nr:hypothetical protein [Ruminococcus sp.]